MPAYGVAWGDGKSNAGQKCLETGGHRGEMTSAKTNDRGNLKHW